MALPSCGMHRRQLLGAAGEELAVTHLTGAGLQVVDRNWRTSVEGVRGEVDVIALEGTTLALIEVRTRRGAAAGTAAESVGRDKRRRLRRLAGLYLQHLSVQGRPHHGPVRGDVITVHAPVGPAHPTTVLTHLRGVW